MQINGTDLVRGMTIGGVGMGVVFLFLGVYILIILGLRRLFPSEAPAPVTVPAPTLASAPASVVAPPLEVIQEPTEDLEEMAAAAAVGLYLALEEVPRVSPSYGPRAEFAQLTPWQIQGRASQMRSREPRR